MAVAAFDDFGELDFFFFLFESAVFRKFIDNLNFAPLCFTRGKVDTF